MTYHPNIIANFFISKSFATGEPITPMKLVKLVYISHGWYLGLAEKPLISEAVQAWKFGPVIPSVYHAFKRFGGANITSLTHQYEGISPDQSLTNFLDKIWEVYRQYTGLQLSTITHEKGTPWSVTWHNRGLRRGVIIPNDLIMQHYKEKISERA